MIKKGVLFKAEDGVVETVEDDLVPSPAEDQIRHGNLILEGGSEGALASFPEGLFDLPPDPRNSPNLCSEVAGYFHGGIEHVPDECGVLHDLVGLANQLDLLEDLG